MNEQALVARNGSHMLLLGRKAREDVSRPEAYVSLAWVGCRSVPPGTGRRHQHNSRLALLNPAFDGAAMLHSSG
jgi:hypothetical protein